MDAPASHANTSKLLRPTKGVQRPEYDRSNLKRSITHIGVGGFHRSHFASFIDQLCRTGETDWAIVGSGILAGDQKMAEALESQDYLYTLIAKDSKDTDIKVIGSIIDYISAFSDTQPLVDQIAHPDTQIVSLTLTEGGYPIDSAGDYIPHKDENEKKHAFDLIAAALKKRRDGNIGPVTIMSFDNIISNGDVTQTATLGAVAELDSTLLPWISENVTFPNSMVDRITVQTKDSDITQLAEKTGLEDAWPVVTEPFIQWAVEDKFAGQRLPLEGLDVIVTDNVEPFEVMKLRLLNASHSCLAYLASLASFTHVHTALSNEWVQTYVLDFLDKEAQPSISGTGSLDLQQYSTAIVQRFKNPEIADQIARLAIDGSSKFHTFLYDTIKFNLKNDGPIELSTLALAAWSEYLSQAARNNDDTTASALVAYDANITHLLARTRDAFEDPVKFLDGNEAIAEELATNTRFRSTFTNIVKLIRKDGIRSATEQTTLTSHTE